MDKFEKFCQSCSMPLKDGQDAGTEADGTKSYKYCKYCYEDGAFTDPDMTLEKMMQVLDDTVGKDGMKGKFFAWMGKKQLPKLERWSK